MSVSGPLMDDYDRKKFVNSLWELHDEISLEITKPSLDASRLMRLMAIGINHCMVGLGTILMESASARSSEDSVAARDHQGPIQLEFPFPDLMEGANRETI